MQFTAQRAFYKIYDPVSDLFKDRLYGINPDLTKKLEIPEKSPGEYCNDFVEEFIDNVAGQSKEQVGKYAEVLYYQLAYRVLTLLDYHQAYYKRFGMDSDNERLANNYMSPLSMLVTNIFNISWDLSIAELVDLDNINLKTDFDLRGTYKFVFSREIYREKMYPDRPELKPDPLPQPGKKRQGDKTESVYKFFTEIFIDQNPENINKCVDALRRYSLDIHRPVLGQGLTYTGEKFGKKIIVAWIRHMETMKNPKIYKVDYKYLVALLNGYFTNLDLGLNAGIFDNYHMDREIIEEFNSLLPD